MKRRWIAIAVAACAATAAAGAHAEADARDPLEPFNRKVDSFNRGVDHAVLRPVAKGYERVAPSLVRRGVSNFFANLGDAWSTVNSALQLKGWDTAENGMRLVMNTMFGFGLLDLATEAGIERHKEDFGTTLAHWGVPAGPYLVLPLFGPATVRDAAALPVDLAAHPLSRVSPAADRNALGAARVLDTRARMLPLDAALDQALDPYTFMRDVYLQHRNAQVHAGGSGEDVAVPEPGDE